MFLVFYLFEICWKIKLMINVKWISWELICLSGWKMLNGSSKAIELKMPRSDWTRFMAAIKGPLSAIDSFIYLFIYYWNGNYGNSVKHGRCNQWRLTPSWIINAVNSSLIIWLDSTWLNLICGFDLLSTEWNSRMKSQMVIYRFF